MSQNMSPVFLQYEIEGICECTFELSGEYQPRLSET